VWAAAVEPNWYLRPAPTGGGLIWERRIVYCHTSQMKLATQWRRKNRCVEHGGYASYDRCSTCPDNHGFNAMGSRSYPEPEMPQCETGDLAFDPRRAECRGCYQKMQCVGKQLKGATKIRLVVLR